MGPVSIFICPDQQTLPAAISKLKQKNKPKYTGCIQDKPFISHELYKKNELSSSWNHAGQYLCGISGTSS